MQKLDAQKMNEISKGTLTELLGIQITEFKRGRIVATMPVTPSHHQPMGLMHGGASLALAETVASLGGAAHITEEGKTVVGQEINANHFYSVRSGLVKAIGEPLHIGKKSQVWEVKIYNEDNKLICVSRCTLAVVGIK